MSLKRLATVSLLLTFTKAQLNYAASKQENTEDNSLKLVDLKDVLEQKRRLADDLDNACKEECKARKRKCERQACQADCVAQLRHAGQGDDMQYVSL